MWRSGSPSLRREPEEDQVWEALNARTVGDDVVEVRGVPALAYHLAFGDRVSVMASAEGALCAIGPVTSGSFATFRIWLGQEAAPDEWRDWAESFAQLGCLIDVYTERLMSLACPIDRLDTVRSALEHRESDQPDWAWEESATPPGQ